MPADTAKRDYYEVLGLDRSATQEQIKQAYRQLAMQWHPDRNPAPDAADSFKEIAEAYAVLSDDTKRQAYDTTGHAGVNQRWSTEDIFHDFNFGDFFGGHSEDLGSLFGNLFGGRAGRTTIKPHGADLRCELKLTLEQAAAGGEHLIHITKQERCKTCGGNGAKPGTKPQTCAECKGTGEKQQARKDKAMNVVTIFTCTHCNGTGRFIEQPCASCQGAGSEFLPHAIKVQVPAGVDHGMLLRLAGQGQAGPGSTPPGDLLVRVYLQPHPHLKRDGDDLYTTIAMQLPRCSFGRKNRRALSRRRETASNAAGRDSKRHRPAHARQGHAANAGKRQGRFLCHSRSANADQSDTAPTPAPEGVQTRSRAAAKDRGFVKLTLPRRECCYGSF